MSQIIHKLSNYSLNEFRILVRKAMMLTKDERKYFFIQFQKMFGKKFMKRISIQSYLMHKKVILGNTSASPIIHTETRFLERVKKILIILNLLFN